ncbi:DUF1254 domain-containing protein [Microbacterium sp. B35-30]|uniref:DUF1254 domain-containing protein n=1 Tax=Microbacterium sp. B35-30 TaxID=1962642 RepID=UPI0013D52965|nr:DUF1254 domain-containing protein [Microbacterium sp. B35-30]KAF2415747.1 hypothetical protein B2K11_18805 [Microbacterium sp. B35-30]
MTTTHPGISAETLASISTPDRVESRLGTLEFSDGTPSDATASLLYDHLDFTHAVEAFLGSLRGASIAAVRRGHLSVGVEDNAFLLFSDLMDSTSLFLTANCDTVYFWGFIDVSDHPMVIDVPSVDAPSGILGTIDDMWFRWITDVGLPGPDRGEGGRYLIVGPGYDGPLPESGYHVFHSRTTRATLIGRAFMVENDPTIPVAAIREGVRVHPYIPGAHGTAVSSFLAGRSPLGAARSVGETRFVEASGMPVNTIFPNDFGFWELVNELVQQEPPGSGDPELLGLLASVGIVHGKPFEPDARMRKILEEAVVVGNATARTLTFAARPEEGFGFYPDSQWQSALFLGGYQFLDPPPQITARGVIAAQSDGARKINSATNFFYMATGITPAMCMRLTGIGSQYIFAMRGSDGEYLDGARNYRLTLPPDVPESRFWSVLLYDNQTRSMLQTDQHLPRLGSQSGTVHTNPDGSTDLYFGPTAPEGKEDNWLQTVPGKGWWTILRLYNPLQSFFDKSWRPGEIEPV